MIALLDLDIVVYKAGCSSEKTVYQFVYNNGAIRSFDNMTYIDVKKELKTSSISMEMGKLRRMRYPDPIEFACRKARLVIESIMDGSKADSYKGYLTANDKSNFRFALAKTQEYKGNRKDMKKPIHYDALREYVIKYYDAEVIYNQEADDALGIEQTKRPDKTVICSIDKDLDMIPGYHYNADKDQFYVAEDPGTLRLSDDRHKLYGTGLKWFYAQMLLGDSADNIPGLKGYGPVGVYNVLHKAKTEEEMIDITKKLYDKKSCLNRYKEVADLLWIRRYPNEVKSTIL